MTGAVTCMFLHVGWLLGNCGSCFWQKGGREEEVGLQESKHFFFCPILKDSCNSG